VESLALVEKKKKKRKGGGLFYSLFECFYYRRGQVFLDQGFAHVTYSLLLLGSGYGGAGFMKSRICLE